MNSEKEASAAAEAAAMLQMIMACDHKAQERVIVSHQLGSHDGHTHIEYIILQQTTTTMRRTATSQKGMRYLKKKDLSSKRQGLDAQVKGGHLLPAQFILAFV